MRAVLPPFSISMRFPTVWTSLTVWPARQDCVRRGPGRTESLPRRHWPRRPSLRPPSAPMGLHSSLIQPARPGGRKGVRLTHRGMLWSIHDTQQNWPTNTAEVGQLQCRFSIECMRGTIKPVLYAGAKAVNMPKFEPRDFSKRRLGTALPSRAGCQLSSPCC